MSISIPTNIGIFKKVIPDPFVFMFAWNKPLIWKIQVYDQRVVMNGCGKLAAYSEYLTCACGLREI